MENRKSKSIENSQQATIFKNYFYIYNNVIKPSQNVKTLLSTLDQQSCKNLPSCLVSLL